MSNITIGIAAEFKGKKAFKDADKSTSALEKGVKKLGTAIAGAFAAEKILAFGKASVKAFLEEEKSAALLANTMKNLGLSFATPQMETFISQLSQTAGVADEVHRPAMQKLISQTGDYFKSQEILTQAIEVSRGSGVELATVVSDLSAAYVGNTKGLKKYNLGLTQAELKTMKFADVQKKLNDQFKGSNAAYLETYAGKMEVLKTAAGEAQETIGKGLVDALMAITGDTSVADLAESMKNVADYTADAIVGLGNVVAKLKQIGEGTPDWLKKLGGLGLNTNAAFGAAKPLLDYLQKSGEKSQNSKMQNPSVQMFMTDQNNARLAREKLKTENKIVAATKANTAELKKQAAEKKQAALFDLEKIGLVAALQGKITEEEKLRLELQLALLTGNDEKAAQLSQQLANSIDKTGNLAKFLTTLPDANNPFKNWDSYLTAIEKRIRELNVNPPTTPPSTNVPANVGAGGFIPSNYGVGAGGSTGGTAATTGGSEIVINIDGKEVARAMQQQYLNGINSKASRMLGMFGDGG